MSEICESCKKRGRKPISETLTPDELSIEQERARDEVPNVLELRQVKHVPAEQSEKMKQLRADGLTLREVAEEIEYEYGDKWSLPSVEYHTDPAVREKTLKYNMDRYLEGQDSSYKLSDQSLEYMRARQKLEYRLQALGYTDAEIRELFEKPEYQRRGRYEEAEESFKEMTPKTTEFVRLTKEVGDSDMINYHIARDVHLTVNDAMSIKRQLIGAGLQDIADAIDLNRIKGIKDLEEYPVDRGGWDRLSNK